MGVNAQTTVPKFTAGQVLTAAQQTGINTGIPVFATTTTRDAAFGGSNKVLAEGQFAYIEASNTTQYYDGAAWQSVGASGITLISTTSPSAAATVTMDNVFNSTYQHYLITFGFTGGSTEEIRFQFRYGSTTQAASYYSAFNLAGYAGGSGILGSNNASYMAIASDIDRLTGQFFVTGVGNSSQNAMLTGQTFCKNIAEAASGGGYVNASQTFTGFILTNSGGTSIFTGKISVYGLAGS